MAKTTKKTLEKHYSRIKEMALQRAKEENNEHMFSMIAKMDPKNWSKADSLACLMYLSLTGEERI